MNQERTDIDAKPHIVVTALTYLLAALSAAAGIPKIMQMPQELGFLAALGFPALAVSMLGVVQLAGGVLLLLKKLRLAGAALAGLAFFVSSIAIFAGGNNTFGLVSLLPVAALAIVFYNTWDRSGRAES